ncbi:hypothetical protein AAY473_006574 [Plecturocebus cupreus]
MRWLKPVIPQLWEAEVGVDHLRSGVRPAWTTCETLTLPKIQKLASTWEAKVGADNLRSVIRPAWTTCETPSLPKVHKLAWCGGARLQSQLLGRMRHENHLSPGGGGCSEPRLHLLVLDSTLHSSLISELIPLPPTIPTYTLEQSFRAQKREPIGPKNALSTLMPRCQKHEATDQA